MVARSILETEAVITGSRGKGRRPIVCKLGHRFGKVVITETIATLEGVYLNPMWIEVILGERNKKKNGIDGSSILRKKREIRFGNKGSLTFRSCMAERSSTDGVLRL